ncbi:MAG: hypothetical protein QOG04_2020 [Actinomycetota bacterium]|jgi:endonuclease/exonuclease/phosphatase family metal-dependent hydrolase|nr:hypothetical protein [Actinomycetota bacterium]
MTDTPIRVATFNIRHAQGKSGAADIQATADVIKSLEADLIAIQELDVGLRRSKRMDQPAELADRLGMHVYFAPAMSMDQGEYGIALAASDEFRATVEQLPRANDEEPRVAIIAGWRGIGIVTTHLSRSAAARNQQTDKLADLVGKLGTPAIVLGDLNQPIKSLGALTGAGLTPAKAPMRAAKVLRRDFQIDHILVTKDLEVRKAWTIPTSASDHNPLIADIARRSP